MQGPTTARDTPAREPAKARFADRVGELVLRIPLALAVAVLAAALLRIIVELSYRPAALSFIDSAAYVGMADDRMFVEPVRAAGYSMLLEVAHSLSSNIERTIEIQHLLGLATGIAIYATVRRVGAPVWVALVGAAAVLFSLDQIHLEHTIASESPFTFLYAVALYAAVRSLDPGRQLAGPFTTREAWLLAAGLLLGASAWVRGVAAPLIPFLALWVVFAIPGTRRARAARAGVATVPALALVLLYMALNSSATGTFGLIRAEGWSAYARTAPFADCSQFTPPEGTEVLCEDSAPSERPAPDFYASDEDSAARRTFGLPPSGDDRVGAFGWAAIRSQPLAYARAVGDDFLRYFFPDLNAHRPYTDTGSSLEIAYREPLIEEFNREPIDAYYEPVGPVETTGMAGALADVQQLLRVHPVLLLQAALLTALGCWFGRGRVRAATALLGGSALLMLLIASFASFSPRFAVPVGGPLLAAGALGLWALLERYRRGAVAAPVPEGTVTG